MLILSKLTHELFYILNSAGAMVHSLVQLVDGEAELWHGQAVGEDEGGGALLLQQHSVSGGRSRHVSGVSQRPKGRRKLMF